MRVVDAAHELATMLRSRGVPLAVGLHPRHDGLDVDTVRRAWSAFTVFGRLPVDDAGPDPEDDGLLFQTGVYAWPFLGGPRYNLSFTRQFAFYEEGEYDRLEQLECCFYYEPTPELDSLEPSALWSFGHELAEFFALVEATPGFRVPLDNGLAPVGYRLAQEAV